MPTFTGWFGRGALAVAAGRVPLDTAPLRVTLHGSDYDLDPDTDEFFDDATDEVVAAGYTAGGVLLAQTELVYDAATRQVRLVCQTPTWAFTATATFRHAVIRHVRGGLASADELVGYVTWDADQMVTGLYGLRPDPTGLLRMTLPVVP